MYLTIVPWHPPNAVYCGPPAVKLYTPPSFFYWFINPNLFLLKKYLSFVRIALKSIIRISPGINFGQSPGSIEFPNNHTTLIASRQTHPSISRAIWNLLIINQCWRDAPKRKMSARSHLPQLRLCGCVSELRSDSMKPVYVESLVLSPTLIEPKLASSGSKIIYYRINSWSISFCVMGWQNIKTQNVFGNYTIWNFVYFSFLSQSFCKTISLAQ